MTPARGLKERLQTGETLVGTFVKLGGADAAEVVAGAGFDFAIVDREHSQLSDAEARAAVRAIRALGMPALVRVPAVDRGEINRLLEAGAAGIQLAAARSAAQANALAMATRYAPAGARSISLAHAQAGYGAWGLADYLAASDGAHAPLAVIQLETATTDDPLAEILAAADVAFIGTTDLLVDTGLDATAARARMEAIVAAATDVGRPWGGFAADAEAAARMVAEGARYVVVSSDLALLRSACAATARAAREAVRA
jgi:4-hydroxy-2-oxoheptanedioate aldolase